MAPRLWTPPSHEVSAPSPCPRREEAAFHIPGLTQSRQVCGPVIHSCRSPAYRLEYRGVWGTEEILLWPLSRGQSEGRLSRSMSDRSLGIAFMSTRPLTEMVTVPETEPYSSFFPSHRLMTSALWSVRASENALALRNPDSLPQILVPSNRRHQGRRAIHTR